LAGRIAATADARIGRLLQSPEGNPWPPPHFDRQIVAVTTILRISDDQHEFTRNFEKAFPKDAQQLRLPLRVAIDPEE